jgi:hypothetical protein
MVAIKLKALVDENRRLVIDLPDDVPIGPVELTITAYPREVGAPENPAREAARAKLLAAGALMTRVNVPNDTVLLSPEALLEIGRLPDSARTSEALIDEDRGDW